MEVVRIAEGLWRWTTAHPAWTPEAGWGPEVGSTFVDTGTEIVVVDPLVPRAPAEADRFWRALDRDVERAGSPPVVLLTSRRHTRSAGDLRARYPGARVLSPPGPSGAEPPIDACFATGDALPAGIEAHATASEDEAVLWIAAHRALVTGDVLVGRHDRADAPLRVGTAGAPGVTAAGLRHLLDLPVERILPAHGEPVLQHAHGLLAVLLGR